MNFSGQLTTILEKYVKDELNPAVWLPDQTLRPDVRENLLQIAKDFSDQHVLPDEAIEDIILTGSIANFNWGEFSDIDLHLVVDFSKVDENRELVYDYYRMAKSVWNGSHEIDICGHEVEVYVQDSEESHHSTGVYSIQRGEWITEPTKDTSTKPSESSVQQKAQDFVDRIDRVSQMVEDGNDSASAEAEKLKDRVKKMRQAGLESAGEFSVENLAFKYLRNEGHLDRLSDLRKQAYDQNLSVDQCQTENTMRLLAIQNDTIVNSADTIVEAMVGDEIDVDANTMDYEEPSQTPQHEVIDAQNYLNQIRDQNRAGKDPNNPMDFEQRLDLALRDSEEASNLSHSTANVLNNLSRYVQSGFNDIGKKLDKIARGEPYDEPVETGVSVFDED